MNNELYHHGTLGMHWGQRRYQNEDGSYKPGAEGRYYTPTKRDQKRAYKDIVKSIKQNKYNGTKNAIKKHMDKVMTMEDRMRISQEYVNKYNAQLTATRKNGEPYNKDVQAISEQYDKEVESYVNKVLGKYADVKVKNLNTTRDMRSFVQEYIRDQADYDAERLSRLKTIESDRKTITDQVSKIMLNDLKRWNFDAGKSKSKEDYAKIQESIQKQVSDGLKDYKNTGRSHESFPDGTINFIVDGGKDYADGQSLEVIYDPKNKKVVGTYWA